MKKERNFIVQILMFVINITGFIFAFVKTHFNPLRQWRLKGLKLNVAGKVSAVAYGAKQWHYRMFSRWHVDMCNLSLG